MATIITNYTTYDLAYYYADLKSLPQFSRDERQHLLANLPQEPAARAALLEPRLKRQLIESYLPFAKHLAITLRPATLYRRLLPELIGAVNLAVVEAVMRADLNSTSSLDAYVAAYVRGHQADAECRRVTGHICSGQEACEDGGNTRPTAQAVSCSQSGGTHGVV